MKAFPVIPAILALGSIFSATAQIPTGDAADLVIGQTDFETRSTTPINAASLNRPRGIAIDPTTGKLFVADAGNNRVLRYASIASLTSGAAAEGVLGQLNFSDTLPNQGETEPDAKTLDEPNGLAVDSAGRLWVVDNDNNRVLMFENASTLADGSAANKVLGKPDFSATANSSGAAATSNPSGIHVDSSGNLWVADTGYSRVLRFADAANKPNGADADQVFGQTTFTGGGGDLAANRLDSPRGVFVDAFGTLWVADYSNQRVLGFSNAASLAAAGAAADRVIGQPDFTSNTAATSINGLRNPMSVAVDPFGALWVIERLNHRITVSTALRRKPMAQTPTASSDRPTSIPRRAELPPLNWTLNSIPSSASTDSATSGRPITTTVASSASPAPHRPRVQRRYRPPSRLTPTNLPSTFADAKPSKLFASASRHPRDRIGRHGHRRDHRQDSARSEAQAPARHHSLESRPPRDQGSRPGRREIPRRRFIRQPLEAITLPHPPPVARALGPRIARRDFTFLISHSSFLLKTERC